MKFMGFFCLFIFAAFFNPIKCRKLLQGHVVWRHADRSTEYTYPSDPYLQKWKYFLHSDKGLSEEFDLGVYMRSKYGHLLNDEYRYVNGEVYFRSIDTDRSLISAQSVASGLYAHGNRSTLHLKSRHNFQPFPIHTVDKNSDWMYKICQDPQHGCPSFNNVIENVQKHSAWFKAMENKYKGFLATLGQKAGSWIPYSFNNVSLLNDNLQFLSFCDKTLPSWADEHVLDQLEEIAGYALGLEFTDYEMKYSKVTSKFRSGVILENIFRNIEKTVKGHVGYSLYGYTVNDKGITALLTSMGAYNWIVPPYVSSVMIDLYIEDDKTYSVELSYKNETYHEPYPLHFYECGSNCSWDKFKSVSKLVVTDGTTRKLCGLQERQDCCKYLIPGILLLMSTTLLFFPLFYCLKRLNSKKREKKYSILPLDETDIIREGKSL